jgi:alpha-tubulin suppressor-like RCC1 family protein
MKNKLPIIILFVTFLSQCISINAFSENMLQNSNINEIEAEMILDLDETVASNINSRQYIIKYKNDKSISQIKEQSQTAFNIAKADTTIDKTADTAKTLSSDDVSVQEWINDYSIVNLCSDIDNDTFINSLMTDEDIGFVQPVNNFCLNDFNAEDNAESMIISDTISKNIGQTSDSNNETHTAIVALVDTGIDINNTELQNNLWSSDDGHINGWNCIDNNSTVYDYAWANDMTHGTHLAGIIGGLSNLDTATNDNVKIMVLRAFQDGKSDTITLVNAIQFAISNGAEIINCSWGCSNNDLVLYDVIKNNPDILFVCSAGNGGNNIDKSPIYPASYDLPNIISVASTNHDNGLSYFSNYGPEKVDIAACGRNVESTFPNNKRGVLSGTSIATAYVTRALSELKNISERKDIHDIKRLLYNTSDKLSSLEPYIKEAKKVNLNNIQNNISITDIQNIDFVPDMIKDNSISNNTSWQLFQTYRNAKIETAGYITLLLKDDNTVWAVGSNMYGQLGDGSFEDSSIPHKISSLNDIVDISVSTNHCLALKSDGTVWAWGNNASGQLGISGGAVSNIPMQVIGLSNITQICAGYEHSMALDADGNVWTWGANTSGQLGRAGTTGTANVIPELTSIEQISSGEAFSVALDTNGTIWTWGDNTYGQLGNNTTSNQTVPTSINGTYTTVDAGYYHCLAINRNGDLVSWGYNNYGQLGVGNSTQFNAPVIIEYENASKVSAGYNYSLVVNSTGEVFGCGYNNYGQLGINSTVNANAFTKLGVIDNASYITAGYYHSGAIDGLGKVYTWGYNNYGQLGDGSVTESYIPININLDNIINVSAGYGHCLAVDSNGIVYSWGLNNKGQLGNGNNANGESPIRISNLQNITQIDCGYHHSVALDSTGNVWTWGYNNRGQLGNGTIADSNVPSKIDDMSDVTAVSAGYYHTLALKSDGTVWSWGYNNYGQLGDNTKVQKTSPVQITSLNDIIAISAGNNYSMALKSDGSVWTWGYNNRGQLGLGNTTAVSVPTCVTALSNISHISAGYYHSTALSNSGQIYTWGYNNYGQLGNASNTQSTVPQQLNNTISFDYISNKYNSTLAVDTDGKVYAWGYNNHHQLGTSDTSNGNAPIQTNIENIDKVVSGNFHSVVLNGNGQVLTWGYNNYGQLGNSSSRQRTTPYCISGFISDGNNDDMTNAIDINTDTVLYLSFNSSDNAWYKFVPKLTGQYRINISSNYNAELYEKNISGLTDIPLSDSIYLAYPKQYYLKISAPTITDNSFTLEISGNSNKTLGKAFEVSIFNDRYFSNIRDCGKLYKNQNKVDNTESLNAVSWLCNFNNILYFNANRRLIRLQDTSYVVIGNDIDARYIVADESNIYFSNWSDGGKIYRGSLSEDNTMTFVKICNDSASWLNIDGDYLYYKNGLDNGKTYKVLKTAQNLLTGTLVN